MKKTILLAITAMISLASIGQAKKDSAILSLYGLPYKVGMSSFQNTEATKSYLKSGSGAAIKAYLYVKSDNDTVFINTAGAIAFDDFSISVDSLRKLIKKKPDTAYIPVPLYEVTDTLSATFVYGTEKLKRGSGLVLIRGFKVQGKDGLQWANNPVIAGVLDDKRRPVTEVVNGTLVINPPVQLKQNSPPQRQ